MIAALRKVTSETFLLILLIRQRNARTVIKLNPTKNFIAAPHILPEDNHGVLNALRNTSQKQRNVQKCGKTKPITEFYVCNNRGDNLSSRCKDCDKQHGKNHRKATKDNPVNYYIDSRLLKDATEKELIQQLRTLGEYTIKKIVKQEIDL